MPNYEQGEAKNRKQRLFRMHQNKIKYEDDKAKGRQLKYIERLLSQNIIPN